MVYPGRDVSEGRFFTIKLDVKPRTAAGWLRRAKAVHASSTKSENAPLFATLVSELQQLKTDVDKLDGAQARVTNRGRTDVAERDVEWGAVQKSLRAFVAGVQRLCDEAPDADQALHIAAAATLAPKDKPKGRPTEFRAKTLGNGRVHLYGKRPGKRGARVHFDWQMSTDGGETWVSLPSTNDADTLVEGLTPGTLVRFRHRTTMRNTKSEWSPYVETRVR
jgi:hypothetical protein